MRPLLSVVIANYNYGRFIEAALLSVVNQEEFSQIELIVCDAASSDNSVCVIEKYADKISWWCSERDAGQSDAFNKGFSHAHGKYLTWLNADDIMMPGVIPRLKTALRQNPDCQWFAGGTVWMNPDGKPYRCVRARPFSKMLVDHGHIPVWGPSSIFSRKLYGKTFGFRVDYHYMMDTDLWFRFHYECGAQYRVLPGYLFGLRTHPEAKTSGFMFKASAMSDPNSRGRLAQKAESDDMRSRYPTKPLNLLQRAIGFGWHMKLLEKFDLWRIAK